MNKRQSDLLKTLYNNQGFLTLSEIAEKFDVSAKTIRNDIAAIREYLAEQNAGALEAIPHVGVRAVISEDEWTHLLQKNYDDSNDREIEFFIIRSLMKKNSLTGSTLLDSDIFLSALQKRSTAFRTI